MPTVVVPTYDERENIERLLPALRRHGLEILVVDDGSPDGTADAAEAIGRDLGGIEVLRRAGKGGLASAYVAGFRHALQAGAERLVQMDADLSHDPDDVPRLLAADADVVLGSRYVPGGGTRGWPLHREALSRGGSWYARLWLGLPFADLTGGFKAWRAPILRRVLDSGIDAQGYVFQVEMTQRAVRLGASVAEVPIVFTERVAGRSKMTPGIAIEAAKRVPRLRWR